MHKILKCCTLTSMLLFIISLYLFQVKTIYAEKEEELTMEVIIEYKSEKTKDRIVALSEGKINEFPSINAVSVTVSEQQLIEIKELDKVGIIESNFNFFLSEEKDQTTMEADYSLYQNKSLSQMNIYKAWKDGYTGKTVKIAVGVSDHDDIHIAGGFSTVDYTESYNDDNGHGTHVTGIINAKHNKFGISGVAYGADIFAVKAIDANGNGKLTDVLESIQWAIKNNMDIISMSLGTDKNSKFLKNILNIAYKKGILIISSSGNNGEKRYSIQQITRV